MVSTLALESASLGHPVLLAVMGHRPVGIYLIRGVVLVIGALPFEVPRFVLILVLLSCVRPLNWFFIIFAFVSSGSFESSLWNPIARVTSVLWLLIGYLILPVFGMIFALGQEFGGGGSVVVAGVIGVGLPFDFMRSVILPIAAFQ